MSAIRGLRAAFVFLTRIPVGGFPYTEEDWRWSTAHFPFVGAVLGLLQATVAALLLPHLGAAATALLVIALAMMLTGAFHEDGLADSADALGGAYDRDKLFVILKDSRIGTFGAAALFVALGLRVVLLTQLGAAMPLALLLSQTVARTPPIWLMRALPYVTADGESKSRLVARAKSPQAIVATLWSLGLIVALVHHDALAFSRAIALGIVLVAITVIVAWRFVVRAGGVTGDFLGATEQLAELGVLLVLAWR
ncbi:MAG: adenosylcobinamide-GDP ribazoletransferase [Myxococcota bacterium]|jgi:adenosylcobinamide-GDP ribazoletransferase|nr:adenosylcobinamide-GDP ribazoletransferase [Myxococcota bacterium]